MVTLAGGHPNTMDMCATDLSAAQQTVTSTVTNTVVATQTVTESVTATSIKTLTETAAAATQEAPPSGNIVDQVMTSFSAGVSIPIEATSSKLHQFTQSLNMDIDQDSITGALIFMFTAAALARTGYLGLSMYLRRRRRNTGNVEPAVPTWSGSAGLEPLD